VKVGANFSHLVTRQPAAFLQARCAVSVRFDKFLIECCELSVNGESASVRHCIAPVSDQVHDQLFYLPTIRQHSKRPHSAGNLEFDVFPDQPAEKCLIFLYNFADINYSQSYRLLSAESQKSLG